ncbi:MAG: aspartyl protease family protein [Bacteroidia bacterium]|nr:aspartyl protease family protein [Bacteroidia bacterium]
MLNFAAHSITKKEDIMITRISNFILEVLFSVRASQNCNDINLPKNILIAATIKVFHDLEKPHLSLLRISKTLRKEIIILLFTAVTTVNAPGQDNYSGSSSDKFNVMNDQICTDSTLTTGKSGLITPVTVLYLAEDSVCKMKAKNITNDSSENPSLSIRINNNLTRVPFDYNNKLIKLNIGIKSGQKRHEFILDSGAPTFITDSLAGVYDLKYMNSETVYDTNGNTQNIDFYNIKSIEIGNKQFKEIKAASNKDVACMPILKRYQSSGLLGANVMRNSVWQINYNRREITLTDKSENLPLPGSAHHVRMKTDELGRPVITVTIAGKHKLDCIVDVAYNGSLLLPDRFFSKPVFNDSLSYSISEKYTSGFETQIKQMDYKFL